MAPTLLYIIKANILLALFYSFYMALLRKETFYVWNRIYFVAVILFSTLLPAIHISGFTQIPLINIAAITPVSDINVSGANHTLTVENMALLTVTLGACVLLIRFCIQLLSLRALYFRSTETKLNGKTIVSISENINPFSFFKWIFINPNLYNSSELDEITEHEQIHSIQLHTADIIAYELITIFCWYNPISWLIKKEVKQNLEFLTDRKLLDAGFDRRHYQYSLLKISRIPVYTTFTNNFNFNYLKNRVMMMNKKQSAQANLLKFALIIPVLAGFVLYVNANPNRNSPFADNNSVSQYVAKTPTSPIAFNMEVHDFGTIKESAGKAEAVFTFVNRGKTPIVISNVTASCGCTTPEWTKEPIAPGKQGQIKATYDPKNRIGAFDKTITVETNSEPATFVLRIKGTVAKE